MTRTLALAASLVGCTGQGRQNVSPQPPAVTRLVPPPTAREHLANYLGIRSRITGDTLWVVVCGGLPPSDVQELDAQLRPAGIVRSLGTAGADDCDVPAAASSEPTIGALLVESIDRSDSLISLTARRWRGARWPYEWRERFTFYSGDQRLIIDYFSAID